MPRKKSNTSPPPTRKRATRRRHPENREESPDEQGAILESTANSQAEAGAFTQEKDNTTGKGKRPSIRRNRNYHQHIKWTYELNRDIYQCLVKADRSEVGYMERLKTEWDFKHPEYDHLDKKHLREQAIRVENKGLVNEARQDNERNNQTRTEVNNSTSADNTPITTEENTDTLNHPEPILEPTIEPIILEEPEVTQEPEKEVTDEELEQMVNILKPTWYENYNKFCNKKIEERPYTIRKDRKIEDIEMKAVNVIMEEMLKHRGVEIGLWDINVMQYTSAVTLLARHGKLHEKQQTKTKNQKQQPIWITNIENKVEAIRRKLAHVTLIIKCTESGNFTRRQREIERKLRKKYGSTTIKRLTEIKCKLNHDLTAASKSLKDKKTILKRQRINNLFKTNPKGVYRNFRKNKTARVTDPPKPEEVNQYWSGIVSETTDYNKDAPWLEELRREYCKDVVTKIHDIKREHYDKFTKGLKDNNSPGLDLIAGFWNKNCYSLHSTTFNLYAEISKGNLELPQWLVKTRTTLISKGGNTRDPKNYRPIACENIMLKVYTGCIGLLIEEHCIANYIIAPEQAGAKKEMWGCADQLLINKVVLEEAKKYRRNLFTVWLDYRKAYDSIPHPRILETLRLAKIPENIVNAVKALISKWSTQLNLPTENSNIDAGEIRYNKGVLQGDFLSVVLFILSLSPGSFLINKTT